MTVTELSHNGLSVHVTVRLIAFCEVCVSRHRLLKHTIKLYGIFVCSSASFS